MYDPECASGRVTPEFSELEANILAAHRAEDKALLAKLYWDASRMFSATGDDDAEGFFLTHAWIFALDAGLPEAKQYRTRLVELGRL